MTREIELVSEEKFTRCKNCDKWILFLRIDGKIKAFEYHNCLKGVKE